MDRRHRAKYYKELERFTRKCKKLARSGGAYLAIIASHELYRFLYPYEPYLGFHNKAPVDFIVKKITMLNDFLDKSSKVIKFYDFDVKNFNVNLPSDIGLEKKTSDLYTSLWKKFDQRSIIGEGRELIKKRIPDDIIEDCVRGKIVLDMGCGSGRYSIALSLLGAKKVYALDLFKQSFMICKKIADDKKLNVEFIEGNFLKMPFSNNYFDFVFCNGTMHHSISIKKSLEEFKRVLKPGHKGFIYLYAKGGIFWNTRAKVREIFKEIPVEYTNEVLKVMFLPSNRFIFADTWHVPIEEHTYRKDLERMFEEFGLGYRKVISKGMFDLDRVADKAGEGRAMWGDGEHRYIVEKPDV
jgi:ubiquinone/menaquinone biosynthesis C-methylase UbiE